METYKITKTIRFKLEPLNEQITEITKEVKKLKNENFDEKNFITELHNFVSTLKEYLFDSRKKENNELKFKKDFTIKKDWLKLYAKSEFASIKDKHKKQPRKQSIKLDDISSVKKITLNSFIEVNNTIEELLNCTTSDLNDRPRKEKIGLLFKRLQERNNLPLLFDLIDNINNKNEINDERLKLIWQTDNLKTKLYVAIAQYLPAQSNGIPIAKATFNYYTINKKPTDYDQKTQDELKKLEIDFKDLNSFINFKINDKKISDLIDKKISESIFNDIKDEMKKKGAQHLLLGDIPATIHYDKTYVSLRQILKNIKAKQKAIFYELMTKKDITLDTIKKDNSLYLFHSISLYDFNDFKSKTEELNKLAIKINQAISEDEKKVLRSKKENIAKERGNLLKDKFQYWKKFMELYRTVAQTHGRILAKLKGIEKEKTESQLLQYWAMVLENKGQHQLILFPKENAQKAYQWIKNVSSNNFNTTHDCYKLYWFESFTYKSLQKLCWGHIDSKNNTFYQGIIDIIPVNEKGHKFKGEYEFNSNEQEKINFYKKVLNHYYTKRVLNLPFDKIEQEINTKDFSNLEEFQIALEKICYKRFALFVDNPQNILNNFKAQIFNITSLDLSKQFNQDKIKKHIQIWKQFWSNDNEQKHYDIRLNPEITITYREPKSSRVHKYGQSSSLYGPSIKNRYLYPQFTLITTISEHSNAPTKNLAFISDEEYKKEVEKFNKKFNKENIQFAFGIDVGEVELSTLSIFLPAFLKDTGKERIQELKKVKEYGFETLTIKDLKYSEFDYKGKEKKIILNPSYFIDKELYKRTFNKCEEDYYRMFEQVFEKKHLISLDLSTAKVICGHIITNGDVPALFNLWMRHAERNIYEMNDHIKKETAKKVFLKPRLETKAERYKFVKNISDEKKFKKLNDQEIERYISWILDDRNQNKFTKEEVEKFDKTLDRKGNFSEKSGIVFAVSAIKDEIIDVKDVFDIRNIFKKREEFYALKTKDEILNELNRYNTTLPTNRISNEELDLQLKNLKEALVANAIGVIDFLYKQYKQRCNGEGIIVIEHKTSPRLKKDLEKFSGNIYRTLERKLYQKFQNYGLVPPIKSLLSIRDTKLDKNSSLRLGNIVFVDESGTSQTCPACDARSLKHTTKCKICDFEATMMHSNDGIAGFNIARRGYENFQ